MEILHVSAECYPMAKAGGLADVVGALPKYQTSMGHYVKVVMPMHRTKFLMDNEWEVVHKGAFDMGAFHYDFTIIKEASNSWDLISIASTSSVYSIVKKSMAIVTTPKGSRLSRSLFWNGCLNGITGLILFMFMIITQD